MTAASACCLLPSASCSLAPALHRALNSLDIQHAGHVLN